MVLVKFTPRASGLTGNRKPNARECALRFVVALLPHGDADGAEKNPALLSIIEQSAVLRGQYAQWYGNSAPLPGNITRPNREFFPRIPARDLASNHLLLLQGKCDVRNETWRLQSAGLRLPVPFQTKMKGAWERERGRSFPPSDEPIPTRAGLPHPWISRLGA